MYSSFLSCYWRSRIGRILDTTHCFPRQEAPRVRRTDPGKRVEGQVWRAETIGGTIKRGESVEVIRREGLILRVKPTHEN